MKLRRLSVLLTALLAVGAWSRASNEHQRLARTPETRRQASRTPSPGPAFLPDDEFLVDTTITYWPKQADQTDPAVAFGLSEYLVVWQDHDGIVYGARVTTSGDVLDPAGIGIARASIHSRPAAAFDGANFLVVFRTGSSINGARVSPSGVVLDPECIPVCSLSVCLATPAVASGDSACLVVWTQERDSVTTDIYGARVTRSGVVLDPDGIPIAQDSGNQDEPAVAPDGSNYLVVFRDACLDSSGDISAVRVSSAGVVLDTTAVPIVHAAGAQDNPSVSFGDSVYLVAWDALGSPTGRDIFCARISPTGQLLDTNGISVSAADSAQVSPVAVFDGTDFMLTWTDSRHGRASDIYGARLTQAGIVLDTLGVPVCSARRIQQSPALASDDTMCLAVWQDGRNGGSCRDDIYAERISRSGLVGDTLGLLVSIGQPSSQTAPAAAFVDTCFLVAWYQWDLHPRVRYARVGLNGGLLDSAPGFAPGHPPSSGPAALAAADTDALIVSVGGGIIGARVTPSGTLRDTSGIWVVSDTGSYALPTVASDGSNWLVAWRQSDSGASSIRAARVSAAGALLDSTAINFCTDALGQTALRVAFGDSLYVVLWVAQRPGGRSVICAGRVTRSGEALDTLSGRVTFDSGYAAAPDVVFGGSGFLVVWEDQPFSGGHHEICGARLAPDGVAIDSAPILISGGEYDCRSPAVAFDGTDYLVAWQDDRQSPNSGIYAARVSRWGTVFQTFPLTPQSGERTPCLTRAPGGSILLTYEASADSVNGRPFGWPRIWGRLSPFEAIEEVPTQTAGRITLDVLPNPFSGKAEVRYALPVSSYVRLEMYDISGRVVRLLADDEQKAGNHVLHLNGAARDGRLLANGVYILRLDAEGRSETRTLTIAR